jgi:hypothetical protein
MSEGVKYGRPQKSIKSRTIAAWAGHGLRPPEGYNSFLEYAVATMDTRSLELKDIFSDENNRPSREDFRQAVKAEFDAICNKIKDL